MARRRRPLFYRVVCAAVSLLVATATWRSAADSSLQQTLPHLSHTHHGDSGRISGLGKACPQPWSPSLFPPPVVPVSKDAIVVADLRTASNTTKLAATTLQGLVNSGAGSGADGGGGGGGAEGGVSTLYLILAEWDTFWLETLTARGALPAEGADPSAWISSSVLFQKYSQSYDTVVVVDPALPATTNVATAIAATTGRAIVISPGDLESLGEGKSVDDLRGRWSTGLDAYRWCFEALWGGGSHANSHGRRVDCGGEGGMRSSASAAATSSHHQRSSQRPHRREQQQPVRDSLTHSLLAYCHPYDIPHHLRDYLVQHKVFPIFIDENDGDAGLELLREVLSAMPDIAPVIGFVGDGSADNRFSEYTGVKFLGEFGKITVAADWSSNLSILSGTDASGLAQAVRKYRERQAAAAPSPIDVNSSKVYLTIGVVESGDAPGYWQYRQYQVWNDSARGQLPISWGVGAGVFELTPAIAQYFVDMATPFDDLYAAISGLGYVHPYRNFTGALPASAWGEYWARARCYMQRLGTNTTGVYTDAQLPFDRSKQDPTTARIVQACGVDVCANLVLGMGRDEGRNVCNGNYLISLPPAGSSSNGLVNASETALVSSILTRWPLNFSASTAEENVQWLVAEILGQVPTDRPAPTLINAMALSWAYAPTQMREVAERLPEYFELVPLQRFLAIARALAAAKRSLLGGCRTARKDIKFESLRASLVGKRSANSDDRNQS